MYYNLSKTELDGTQSANPAVEKKPTQTVLGVLLFAAASLIPFWIVKKAFDISWAKSIVYVVVFNVVVNVVWAMVDKNNSKTK